MMYEEHQESRYSNEQKRSMRGSGSHRDEVYSLRVPAGKRTYFFDVKATRSGKDYFITITESKRVGENRYEKHKIFLYKEDFGKFLNALTEVLRYVKEECLPEYEFKDLPDNLGASSVQEEEHLEEDDTASELLEEMDEEFNLGEFEEEETEENKSEE